MKISEILSSERIVPQLQATSKEGVLQEIAGHICETTSSVQIPHQEVFKALVNRERLGSTGVGEGVAIPHAKIAGLSNLVACFGRSVEGVPFDAIDDGPVRLIFALLVPENSAGTHLKALARISRLLKNAAFRQQLIDAPPNKETLYEAFLKEDGPLKP